MKRLDLGKLLKTISMLKTFQQMLELIKMKDIAIQRIYQRIAGYTTDDNADELRNYPTFTNILEKKALASQPTISRFNNRVTVETLKSYQQINKMLRDKIYSLSIPEHIIFDIDSTNFQTFGDSMAQIIISLWSKWISSIAYV